MLFAEKYFSPTLMIFIFDCTPSNTERWKSRQSESSAGRLQVGWDKVLGRKEEGGFEKAFAIKRELNGAFGIFLIIGDHKEEAGEDNGVHAT